jgi:N-acyl homoserine lactone hydrolase
MFANEWVEVRIKDTTIKVHAISTGMVSVKTRFRESDKKGLLAKLDFIFDKKFTEWLPIWVWVIEHPEGIFIIDTGVTESVNNDSYFKSSGFLTNWFNKKMFRFSIDREQVIDKQLLKTGINPNDVKAVILTHLHLDHVDGLRYFPKAKIIVNKLEWEKPSGNLPELYPDWIKPELIKFNENYQNFDSAFYITDSRDLIAIHTPGHTHGSISVVLKTNDCDLAFTGDVCYYQDQLNTSSYSGVNMSSSFASDTYNRFKVLSKARKLIFLPSHDRDAGYRLNKLIALSVR